MRKKISGIYKITNLSNGKIYIGSSKDIFYRWRKHKEAFERNKHVNDHLQSSVNKYGIENFKFEILEECIENKLIEKEDFYINQYDSMESNKGYNKCSADRQIITEETKRKLREFNLGKKHSEKSKQKMKDNHYDNSAENSPNSKLTWEKVNEIRKLYLSGNYTQKQLAEKFNITGIKQIVNNKSWKDENYNILNLRDIKANNKSKWQKEGKSPNCGKEMSDEQKRKISRTLLEHGASKGENNSNSKLTWDIINQIRELYSTKKYTQRKLAEKFNISYPHICNILNNDIWKDDNYDKLYSKEISKYNMNKSGECHPRAKLTWKKVNKIRELFSTGNCSIVQLSKEYNISKKQIYCIINFKAWKVS